MNALMRTLPMTALASFACAAGPIPDNTATVLGKAMVNDSKAWCEFKVWGRGKDTMFVWSLCEARTGATVSAPAVVTHSDSKALNVQLPRNGARYSEDVKRMFPASVQARIFKQEFDVQAALERIAKRKQGR